MPAGADPGMAFVLVQHLAPDHKSILSELVKRYTRIPLAAVQAHVIRADALIAGLHRRLVRRRDGQDTHVSPGCPSKGLAFGPFLCVPARKTLDLPCA